MNSLLLIRLAVAFIFLTHGITRVYIGGVKPFGEQFLDAVGFAPLGLYIAWAITLFELVGGTLLLLGKFVRPIAVLFVFNLLMGIVLVHFKEGWFVVGAGRNGFEYSFVLIVCLVSLAFHPTHSSLKHS
ncbi:MAG: DoxX family protein [Saprospiraceae bacterium]|nr:DoxX family protein [Saprospiraceae bacterium]